MSLSETLLNEGKSWATIQKKVNIIRKNIDKIDTDIWQLQMDVRKMGAEPEDWRNSSSYATDELKDVMDKVQELVDLFNS